MSKEKMIEILIDDRCTQREAERFLQNGTVIYTAKDFESNYMEYASEDHASEEDIKDLTDRYKNMIDSQDPITDWSIVNIDGERYYIEYVN